MIILPRNGHVRKLPTPRAIRKDDRVIEKKLAEFTLRDIFQKTLTVTDNVGVCPFLRQVRRDISREINSGHVYLLQVEIRLPYLYNRNIFQGFEPSSLAEAMWRSAPSQTAALLSLLVSPV